MEISTVNYFDQVDLIVNEDVGAESRSGSGFVNGLAYFKIRCYSTVPTEHNRVSIKSRPWRYADQGFMSGPLVRD